MPTIALTADRRVSFGPTAVSAVLLAIVAAPAVGRCDDRRAETTWPPVDCGIIVDGYLAVPSRDGQQLDGTRKTYRVSLCRRNSGRCVELSLPLSPTRWLDGHTCRLQGGFGSIWQMRLDSSTFHELDAGGRGGHIVDNLPGLRVAEAMGRKPDESSEYIWQGIGDPRRFALFLNRRLPALRRSLEKANDEWHQATDDRKLVRKLVPVLYYDFAITKVKPGSVGGQSPGEVDGLMFLQHRHEERRFLLAIRFPVRMGEPTCEEIAVPFVEPFYCAVDAAGNYNWVTESGLLYRGDKPAEGKPRATKEMIDPAKWRVRILLRDAATGAATAFAQYVGKESGVADLTIPLATGASRRELPAGFLAKLEAKPVEERLNECANAIQGK
ncbi:MAG: hypothetical protein U0746_05185 [Gemmataceae bacterium]